MIGFLYRIIRMEAKIESSIESVDKKLELHIEESHGVRTMLEYKIAGLSERMKEIIICLNANGK